MAKNRNVLSWRDAMKKLLAVMVTIFLLSSCAYEGAEGIVEEIEMPLESETITAETLDTMELPELIEESTPKEDEAPEAQIFTPDESGFVWRVPPTLEYTRIHFCCCGMFFNEWIDGEEVDPVTGLLIGYNHGGHCGLGIIRLVYDRERNLFGETGHYWGLHGADGMHPFEEIAERGRLDWAIAGRLNYVQAVDSSRREYWDDDEWFKSAHGHYPWQLTSEAFLGSFAVMYNGEFVTDFIFDGGYIYRVGISNYLWRSSSQIISMRMNGKWGIVDLNGNETAPFIFDRILVIDNQTAIAVYNGNYGLIDFQGNILAPFVFDRIINIDTDTVFARYNGKYGILDVRQTYYNLSR
ncbi:MAG: WG repeat-containing protein [Defluviitaleaceae bacterium]|nr:WG repeat-containing protein [Defluviitaleaceae bacterium]